MIDPLQGPGVLNEGLEKEPKMIENMLSGEPQQEHQSDDEQPNNKRQNHRQRETLRAPLLKTDPNDDRLPDAKEI